MVVIIFLLLKNGVSLPNSLPVVILVGLTGCNLIIYVKKNCHWIQLNCMINRLFYLLILYVLFLRVVCQELLHSRRNVVRPVLTQNVNKQ